MNVLFRALNRLGTLSKSSRGGGRRRPGSRRRAPARHRRHQLEMLEPRTLLSAAVPLDPAGAADSAGDFQPLAENRQIVVTEPATQTVQPGDAVTFAVHYTSDPFDETLVGLGLRMHFDSSMLTYQGLSGVLPTSLLQQQLLDDAANYDGDGSTDKYVLVAWVDGVSQSWPGEGTLPATLFTANFTAAGGPAGGTTEVNFTASSTSPGYVLDATSAQITIEVPPPQITLGDIVLLADNLGEQTPVFVSGTTEVEGVNFYLQVGDGGAPVGSDVGPRIDFLDIVTGTVFDGNHTEVWDVDNEDWWPNGPRGSEAGEALPMFEGLETTTAPGTFVLADGLLATVTWDTTGITNGDVWWDLSLAGTLAGDTDFGLLTADIVNGRVRVSNPPVADAGGPYTVDEGGTVQLDGSASDDPDALDQVVQYRWDLDGDGLFGETGANAQRGDEVGVSPTFSSEGLAAGTDWTVRLIAVDNNGHATPVADVATVHVAGTVVETLGTVGFAERTGVDPSAGERWYELQTAHRGVLTAVAAFDDAAGDAVLGLYDAVGGTALAEAEPVDGGRRLDWEVEAGQTYYLTLAGPNADVDLTLVNLVQQNADNITVFGTDGDDAFALDLSAGIALAIHGVAYEFNPATVTPVHFDGGTGVDSVELIGSAADETLVLSESLNPLSDHQGEMTYVETLADETQVVRTLVTLDGAEHVRAQGGGGADLVHLYDSTGDDTFVSGPDGAVLSRTGHYSLEVADFDYTHAYGLYGGKDTATFHDTAGNDHFVGTPQFSWMQSPDFFRRAKFFDEVYTDSQGGVDSAEFRDSPGNELFVASPTEGTMTGSGFMYHAEGYKYLHGYGIAGGYDIAKLTGGEGNDQFQVVANGVVPISFLSDNAVNELRTWFLRAKKMDQVDAFSGGGDADSVLFKDSAGNDTMETNAAQGYAKFFGPGFWAKAHGFANVTGLANSHTGDQDVAHLRDSLGDDTFTATPKGSTLEGAGYKHVAWRFNYVHAYGSTGRETAYFSDSAGDEQFVGRPVFSYLMGDGFFYRAKFFEEVYVDAAEGGNDTAALYDTALHDVLEAGEPAGPTWARLSSDNADYDFLYDLLAFDAVTAHTGPEDAVPSDPPPWLTIDSR